MFHLLIAGGAGFVAGVGLGVFGGSRVTSEIKALAEAIQAHAETIAAAIKAKV